MAERRLNDLSLILANSAARKVDALFDEKWDDWVTGDGKRVMLTREECLNLVKVGVELVLLARRNPEDLELFLANAAPATPSPPESR